MSKNKGKKDRQPYCGKCRNHGDIVYLKGHKKDCKYQKCKCKVCILGILRREVNKEQNELRKHGRTQCQIATPPLHDATPLSPASTASTNSLPSSPSDEFKGFKPPPISRRLSELEDFSVSADQLVKVFELDIKALPFAYAVLNVVGSFENAIKKIDEAANMITEASASMESEARITSSNDVGHGLGHPYFASLPGFHPIGVIRRHPHSPNGNPRCFASYSPNYDSMIDY